MHTKCEEIREDYIIEHAEKNREQALLNYFFESGLKIGSERPFVFS